MQAELDEIRRRSLEEMATETDPDGLEALRKKYLGRKGVLTGCLNSISKLPPEQKPAFGKKANELKRELAEKFVEREKEIKEESGEKGEPAFDYTLPGLRPPSGRLHPVTQTICTIEAIFGELGFKAVSGPEIETDYYNFKALNIPEHHPARDDHDSFYLDEDSLLRTQTSPVQVRVMEKTRPPVRIIASGKCYRRDATDATHATLFHQVEGLCVDRSVNFSDLKGVLKFFVERMFGEGVRMRLRPDFFPFTEPSADVSISCPFCGGGGCSSCGKKGWLEILGAGMVDPEVFRHVGYDPEIYTGFAFGFGVERIAMLKYGINDIRLFLENDLRFLSQF